jgi:hypothetical protein
MGRNAEEVIPLIGLVMSADNYLRSLLLKYQVNTAAARSVAEQQIVPILERWGGQHLLDIRLSGSTAKGTANAGANDMDLFIAIRSTTPATLREIYESLYALAATRWQTRKQNVSVGVQLAGYHFDLVPGRLQEGYRNWYSLWRNKAQTWTQTNIDLQVQAVANSGRVEEIRILKLWRTLAKLDFPSFALELATLEALQGRRIGDLANNVSTALSWISTNIGSARLIDPANTNNVVSDDLTPAQRGLIAGAAANARAQPNYRNFVW